MAPLIQNQQDEEEEQQQEEQAANFVNAYSTTQVKKQGYKQKPYY